jgi:hypothetical protein
MHFFFSFSDTVPQRASISAGVTKFGMMYHNVITSSTPNNEKNISMVSSLHTTSEILITLVV